MYHLNELQVLHSKQITLEVSHLKRIALTRCFTQLLINNKNNNNRVMSCIRGVPRISF